MKVDIQAVNFKVDRKLVDFINRKTERLDKFYDKIVGVEVYLKVENTSEKENKTADLLVKIPGDDLVVKKTCKTFEEAVDSASEALERLLVKRKEKTKSHL